MEDQGLGIHNINETMEAEMSFYIQKHWNCKSGFYGSNGKRVKR